MLASTVKKAAVFFATVGLVGHLPKAPGTWGSAAAVVALPFFFLPFSPVMRSVILAGIFIVGGMAAGAAEKHYDKKDPGYVVIDEVLGQWIVFLPFAFVPAWQILLGFALFRFFDIVKPFPIRQAEYWLPGGFGVMLDDVLAGAYSLAVLALLRSGNALWMANHVPGSM